MEKSLVEQLRRGNESAFRYIYEHHYALLCHFANQMLGDMTIAEEIVDDAIFYLWEHRAKIEITHSIRAYLMRTVRNHCLNELNSLRHRTEIASSTFFLPENIEFLDKLFVEENQPLGYLLEQESESELQKGIEELPDNCRAVFLKSRVEQKKYEEIAIDLGISVNTVKYHIKNALALLQQRMEKYLQMLVFYFFLEN